MRTYWVTKRLRSTEIGTQEWPCWSCLLTRLKFTQQPQLLREGFKNIFSVLWFTKPTSPLHLHRRYLDILIPSLDFDRINLRYTGHLYHSILQTRFWSQQIFSDQRLQTDNLDPGLCLQVKNYRLSFGDRLRSHGEARQPKLWDCFHIIFQGWEVGNFQ